MSATLLGGRLAGQGLLLVATLIAATAEFLAATPTPVLAVAGLWLLIGAPSILWYTLCSSALSTPDARALVAVGLAVLTDMLVALVTNTVLPLVGHSHPLGRQPLAAGSVLVILVLAAACPYTSRPESAGGRLACPGLGAVVAAGAVVLTLSIAGPIRLNNGFDGAVSTVALTAITALLVLLFMRRRRYPPAVVEIGLFFAAAGLLSLTSLRGWYITGHDIQHEYRVFLLTADADRWSIAAFRDAYNACLSITLLPTSLSRLTAIPGTYVFKAVFPALFALTPLLVYRAVRNVASQIVALLSAVYFMAFPTFFTDMPFLARQEIAFLLFGCCMVVLTDRWRPIRNRRIVATVLLVGVALSHYSTMYVVLAILGLVPAADFLWRLWFRRPHRGVHAALPSAGFVTWPMVLAAAAAATIWAGPVTDTGAQVRTTLVDAAHGLSAAPVVGESSDTGYSVLGGTRVSLDQRLSQYRAETLSLRQDRTYLPIDEVNKYSVTAVDEPKAPLTAFGAALQRLGINVAADNGLIRQANAQLLQLLLFVGLVAILRVRSMRFRPSRDQASMTTGAVGVLAALTVLPQLSVDYGVLRAFQQGLIVFAPFIAAASLWVFRWAGRKAAALACVFALGMLLDLTGVVPQLLGGYPPQLHLANAGQYYDIYYVHPEERAAIAWVQAITSANRRVAVPSEIQTDRYTFSRLQTVTDQRTFNDIFPTLVGARTYVLLGYTTVTKDEATVFYRGDLVTYRYPIALLDATKNKIYCSDGAEIYR